MNDLVAFINARYDEKERTALAARSATEKAQTTGAAQTAVWTVEPYHPSEPGAFPTGIWVVTGPDGEEGVAVVNGSYRADHMALNDPAAVLADIAMKRRILDEHREDPDCPGECMPGCVELAIVEENDGTLREVERFPFPCRTVRLLGSEFDTHPDYQNSWRP